MPRVYNMGRAGGTTKTTIKGSTKGGIGQGLQTFGNMMGKHSLQQMEQDAATERALIAGGWMEYDSSMGGGSTQPTMQRGSMLEGASPVSPNNQQSTMVPRSALASSAGLAQQQDRRQQQRPGMVSRSMFKQPSMARQGGRQAGGGLNNAVTIRGKQYPLMTHKGKTYVNRKPIKQEDYGPKTREEMMENFADKEDIKRKNARIKAGIDAIAAELKLQDERAYTEDRDLVKSTQSLADQKDVITHRQVGAGYRPKSKQDAIDLRNAGRDIINIGAREDRAGVTHKIKVEQTSREALGDLQTNSGNKKAFDRSSGIYNKTTVSKKVAWWDKSKGLFNSGGTEFITIPPDKVKEGVTPARIQKLSDASGKSVKEILQELGILK